MPGYQAYYQAKRIIENSSKLPTRKKNKLSSVDATFNIIISKEMKFYDALQAWLWAIFSIRYVS